MNSAVVAPVGAPVRPSRCLNFIKILVAAFPSIVFGVFTIIFTLYQNGAAEKNREQDQRQADERNIRLTFENYINDVSNLLLNRKFNRSNSDHLLHIRVKTLAVLRHIDANRRRDIILFLYESRLLRSDLPEEERLNLADADLSDIQFTGNPAAPRRLPFLYLPGVDASNIHFYACDLTRAAFDGSTMTNAKILNSIIYKTSFRRIYAPDMTMGDIIFDRNDIRDTMLHRLRLTNTIDLHGEVDLTNSDLYDPNMSHYEFVNRSVFSHPWLILRNAHLPDGSWGPIDDSNLVQDPGGESTCQSNITEAVWLNTSSPLMSIVSIANESRLSDMTMLGQCSFLARSVGPSVIKQYVSVNSFSVLIDSGLARYNLSLHMGCYNDSSANITAVVNFLKVNLLHISFDLTSTIDHSFRRWAPLIGIVPVGTRIVEVSIGSSSGLCFFDNIHLNLCMHH